MLLHSLFTSNRADGMETDAEVTDIMHAVHAAVASLSAADEETSDGSEDNANE